jgi:hypothetical protein
MWINSMTSTLIRLAIAALLLGATAGCVNNTDGAVGIVMADNGRLAIAVAWCEKPSSMGGWIYQENPAKAVVEYVNPKVGGWAEYEIVDMTSPPAPWRITSGLARLDPGVDYVAEAWPGDGKQGIFGRVGFKLEDVENLKPQQVLLGIPGDVVTWDYFREYTKNDVCASR